MIKSNFLCVTRLYVNIIQYLEYPTGMSTPKTQQARILMVINLLLTNR